MAIKAGRPNGAALGRGRGPHAAMNKRPPGANWSSRYVREIRLLPGEGRVSESPTQAPAALRLSPTACSAAGGAERRRRGPTRMSVEPHKIG
jgi:hypothetical protein